MSALQGLLFLCVCLGSANKYYNNNPRLGRTTTLKSLWHQTSKYKNPYNYYLIKNNDFVYTVCHNTRVL